MPTTTKKKKSSKSMYFDKKVQDSIVEFQKEKNKARKDRIYTANIYPAFYKLVQSLVSVYGFKSANEDIEHLKSDCVSALYEILNKWDSDKGTKAFSYFNVCAKRYLTIHSKRLLKNCKRNIYLDDKDSLSNRDKDMIFNKEYVDDSDLIEANEKMFKVIIEIIDHIEHELKEERDKKCCIAIRKIYNSIEDLEFFNKRAVFVYLREISGLDSTELSASLSNIRKIYRKSVGPNKKFVIFEDEEWAI